MSLSFTWTAQGVDEAVSMIEKVIANINNNVNEVFQTIGHQILSAIQAKAPVKTGYLRDHVTLQQQTGQLTLTSEAPYSIYVEFGTYKMAPRAFFFSSIEPFIPEITRMLTNSFMI